MEFDEEVTAEIKQWNLDNAIKGVVGQSLTASLGAYTMDKLKVLAQGHQLPNRSKMKKGEMVESLAEWIVNEQTFRQQLTIMPEEEYQFLHDVAHGNLFTDEVLSPLLYAEGVGLGYIFIILADGHFYYDMPLEVKNLFIENENAETLSMIADNRVKWEYIAGITNFYGIATFEMVRDLYNEYNDDDVEAAEFERVFALFSLREQVVKFYHEHLVNDYLLEAGEFEALLLNQENYPRYIPTEEQIFDYADDYFFEMTPALVTLKDYLAESFGHVENFRVDALIEDIQLYVAMEYGFQEIFDLFEGYDLKFASIEQAETIIGMLTDVINTTRLWSLNGYTPLEMHHLNGMEIQTPPTLEIPSKEPIRVEKIGRNEPCPCGSGKKYKKCCGR